MKALSLSQPWATLIALQAKQIETRSWRTFYRGALAIHASKHMPAEAKALCAAQPFARALDALFRAGDELPLGAIVAVCELKDCLLIRHMDRPFAPETMLLSPQGETIRIDEPERSFGDYTLGRYAWILKNIRQLEFPISCRGAQGLWQVPAEIVEQIKHQAHKDGA